MNVWDYLNASPVGAAALVFLLGLALARIVRAWRERRPVAVRLVIECPTCGAEHDHGQNHGGIVEVVNA
jgi:hypothetical protein